MSSSITPKTFTEFFSSVKEAATDAKDKLVSLTDKIQTKLNKIPNFSVPRSKFTTDLETKIKDLKQFSSLAVKHAKQMIDSIKKSQIPAAIVGETKNFLDKKIKWFRKP